MPVQPQVVGAHVGDHRDVVAGQPDALEQDARRGRSRSPRARRPRGRGRAPLRSGRSSRRPPPARRRRRSRRCWTSPPAGPACGRGGRSAARWWSCRWCRSPRPRDPRRDRARSLARSAARDPLCCLAHGRLDITLRQRVEHVGHGAAHHLGPLAVPPREGHDDALGVAGRADAHGEPRRTRTRRPRPAPVGRPPAPRTADGIRCPAGPAGRCADRSGRRTARRSTWRPRPATRGPGSA